ncbi:MAG: hypothetical protein HY763_15640 [Planctomycetes bacterium]|nr:hypothetical protein [Planctomycetota bacterium]
MNTHRCLRAAVACRPARQATPARRPAVTLLEIMLAMGILVSLTAMTFWFYISSLEASRRGTTEAMRLRLVRTVLDRIATEIRQASTITAAGRVGVRGEADRLWLSTLRVPTRESTERRKRRGLEQAGDYDLVKVEYKIARHPDVLHEEGWERPLGLARVELGVPRADSAQTGEAFDGERRSFNRNPEAQGASGGSDAGGADAALPPEVDEALLDEEFFGAGGIPGTDTLVQEIHWEELYAPEIHFLRLCYFDGHKWWDDWDVKGENPLPQLVQVTVGFDDHPPVFGEYVDEEVEEFCECMNREPSDCEPLPRARHSVIVRLSQADPLFRSRITRETQDYVKQLTGEP